jgi:hypothetical protein
MTELEIRQTHQDLTDNKQHVCIFAKERERSECSIHSPVISHGLAIEPPPTFPFL